MRSLVLAEHDCSVLNDATRSAVTAARCLGSVDVLVVGRECAPAAAEAAFLGSVDCVLLADDAAFTDQSAENIAELAVELMSGYEAFVAPTSSRGKAVAPRVAAMLDVMQVSDIVGVEEGRVFRRPIYAGNAVQTVTTDDAKLVLTVRTSAFEPVERRDQPCSIEPVPNTRELALSELLGSRSVKSDRPDLGSAKVIVSGGRALRDPETFTSTIAPLADRLHAAIGASRAAVDAGYISNEYQVGQTGKIVAPDVYLAVGISGAIQHLAGMKESKVIIAINSDPDAPIFQVADYGLVGDLFTAIPELLAELEN